MSRLNRLMIDDVPNGRFVTMVYAILDPKLRTVTFANAGHPLPLLVDESGARFLSTEAGLPLGILNGSFAETTVQLSAGSRLVFYSDGITEAADASDDEYGLSRLQEHFRKPGSSADSILKDVHEFTAPSPLLDDATVIVVNLERDIISQA